MTITMPGRFTLGAAAALLALTALFLAVVATSTGPVQGSEQQCEYDVILMEQVCTSSDGETTLSTTSTPTPEPTEETDLARWMPVPDVLHDGSLRPTKEPIVIPPIPPIKNFKYTISTATPKPRVRVLRQIRDVQVQNDQGAQGQGAQIQQTSTALVKNTGQTDGTAFGMNSDLAQRFTTGSNSLGYKLTSVQVDIGVGGTPSTYTVTIADADSSGRPNNKVGDLTALSTLSTGITSFTGSVDLASNTMYYFVLDLTAQDTAIKWKSTTTNAEDSGAAAGWSMADDIRWRGLTTTTWGTNTNTDPREMKIVVNGYAKTPPPATPAPTPATPRGERYFPAEDGGTPVHAKAYSEDRGTLLEYFTAECTGLRNESSPYHDFSHFDADGNRLMARNGWKWVYAQDSQGNLTGRTRAMTISECASNKLYERQQLCSNYTTGQLAPNNKENVCPAARNW